jgi:hypothetical protein
MIQQIIQLLRKKMIENNIITSFVGTRVYPENLASVKDPQFPCITIFFKEGQPTGCIKEIAKDTIVIHVCSEKNYKECFEIYDAIYKNVLHNQRFTDDNYNVVSRETKRPMMQQDKQVSHTLNYIAAEYEVYSQRR